MDEHLLEESIHNFTDSDYPLNHQRSRSKNILKQHYSSQIFLNVFDFIHRGKMDKIQLEYGFLKENLTTIMMLYKNHQSNDVIT